MAFRKFARSHVGIITKYGCSVRKHIEEGICLPATDAFLSPCRCVWVGDTWMCGESWLATKDL